MSSKKEKNKKKQQQQVEFQNKSLTESNKRLGGEKERLESSLKAKDAEMAALKQSLLECEEKLDLLENRAVSIVEPTDDPSLRVMEKIMQMGQEVMLSKQISEEERATAALSFQKQYNEQHLSYLREEMKIRQSDPVVAEVRSDRKQKRLIHFMALIIGMIMLTAGLYIIFVPGNSMAIAGSITLIGIGLIFLLLGIVPYVSAEDTDKVERLAKLFKVPWKKDGSGGDIV